MRPPARPACAPLAPDQAQGCLQPRGQQGGLQQPSASPDQLAARSGWPAPRPTRLPPVHVQAWGQRCFGWNISLRMCYPTTEVVARRILAAQALTLTLTPTPTPTLTPNPNPNPNPWPNLN